MEQFAGREAVFAGSGNGWGGTADEADGAQARNVSGWVNESGWTVSDVTGGFAGEIGAESADGTAAGVTAGSQDGFVDGTVTENAGRAVAAAVVKSEGEVMEGTETRNAGKVMGENNAGIDTEEVETSVTQIQDKEIEESVPENDVGVSETDGSTGMENEFLWKTQASKISPMCRKTAPMGVSQSSRREFATNQNPLLSTSNLIKGDPICKDFFTLSNPYVCNSFVAGIGDTYH